MSRLNYIKSKFINKTTNNYLFSTFEQKCMVEVFDLDKPWEPFHVTTSAYHVVQLHWDPTGSKLMIITDDSNCQVWEMEVCSY